MQRYAVLIRQKINKKEDIMRRTARHPDELKEWFRKNRPDLEFVKILSRRDLTEAQAKAYKDTQ